LRGILDGRWGARVLDQRSVIARLADDGAGRVAVAEAQGGRVDWCCLAAVGEVGRHPLDEIGVLLLYDSTVRVMTDHPGSAHLAIATRIPTGPNAVRIMEGMLSVLRSGGLSDRVTAFAGDLIATYISHWRWRRAPGQAMPLKPPR
jgi:hypothetical protein